MATSLQLFNKVDLQAVMKAGRWSSEGTVTSFYRDPLVPLSLSFKKRGGVSRKTKDGIFYLWESFMVAALEPDLANCPPLSVKFWFYLKCHMNYSKFLDRNETNFCKIIE